MNWVFHDSDVLLPFDIWPSSCSYWAITLLNPSPLTWVIPWEVSDRSPAFGGLTFPELG